MTAEVAIMNARGIALAADSAVTFLKSGKIYNSADKLFALSKHHPVGVMFYGAASFMGIGWEVIVKSYRDSLGSKSFDKLSDYEGDFINYLSKFPYFTEEKTVDYLESRCYEVFSTVLSLFIDDLHKKFDGKENIQLSEINSLFDTTLKETKEIFDNKPYLKHINLDYGLIYSNSETVDKMLEYVFEKYKFSEEQKDILSEILILAFEKCLLSENYSGIVIAGYGEREIFPTICSFKISGKFGDNLFYFDKDKDQVGTDCLSIILPFAQKEMVNQFIFGVDDSFFIAAIEKVETILDSLLPLIDDTNKEKTNAISELLSDYLRKISDTVFKDPIVDVVSLMEKSELVSMAEAMVNLTAIKRHVSEDQESVGGPIDVALITKSDGFIWIKKKTNYDPQLNRELNQNYFRS